MVHSGVFSNLFFIFAGVLQGSILGPLFSSNIVFIWMLKKIGSKVSLFADDISLYTIFKNPSSAAQLLNSDLEIFPCGAINWLVTFKHMARTLLTSRKLQTFKNPPSSMLNQQIKEFDTHEHLEIYLSNNKNINYLKEKTLTRRWSARHGRRLLNVLEMFQMTPPVADLEGV